jgi:restriction system protein
MLFDLIDAAHEYLLAGCVLVLLVVLAQWWLDSRRRGRDTRRNHAYLQRRSRDLVNQLRAMEPVKNPGRVFGRLRVVNPYLFEELILSELETRGLKVTRNASYSGDGGSDGAFVLDGEPWLVQAKRYRGFVKQEHVWAFDQLCRDHGVKGLFVHTGRTPKALLGLERQAGVVRIVSGSELMQLFAGHAVRIGALRPRPAPAAIGTSAAA